jgi:hypothetical protein
MVGKMILPLLGGAPAVWNTCLFFFQAGLLLGYAYSYVTTTRWSVRYQAIAHISLLLATLLFLPIAPSFDRVPVVETIPVLWLLGLLVVSVGLPFFMVSTTAPLIQNWLAQTNSSARKDPYFLYAASNLGSLLGLVCYPVLLEPTLPLIQQSQFWSIGYGLLVILVLGCAVFVWRSPLPANELAQTTPLELSTQTLPTLQEQIQWGMLAFLPSSLLLGVTTYITTDLAAIPLLWAVPLILYLLTFILTFAPRSLLPRILLILLQPLLLTALCLLFLLRIVQPIWLLLPLHLLGLFVVAGVCHGELARQRPDPQHLTLFYCWIALGGVLGGLLNAIAAPVLFPTVLEYPLILLLSLLILQTPNFAGTQMGNFRLGLALPLGLGLLGGGLLVGFSLDWQPASLIGLGLAIALLLGIRYAFQGRWWMVIVGVVLMGLLNQFSVGGQTGILLSDRSFFGVYRILHSTQTGSYHSLLHGTTLHGKQSLDPQRRDEPLTYFTRTGPVGQLFQSLKTASPSRVGVLGLGVGTLATYAQPGQHWTFYEIDPLAVQIATNPTYFTFLQDSRAPFEIVVGDGRLAIAQEPDASYDLLFMDAFSSDSIPLHLMTQEAIQMYFNKLSDRGLLVVNITNRFLDLEPVLGAIAHHLNLATLAQFESNVPAGDRAMGKAPSHWVILARQLANFGSLQHNPRWHPIPFDPHYQPWTDDFSNLLQAIRGL